MDNRQWLSQYWKYPDKMQAVLLKYISEIDILDKIQSVFDRFKDTGQYLSGKEVKRSHEFLENYNFAEAEQLKRKKKIKQREAIVCYIIAELLTIYAKINKKAKAVFLDISMEKYSEITGQSKKLNISEFMEIPMASGKVLENELLGHARYRANKLADFYIMQKSYSVIAVSSSEPQVVHIVENELNSLLKATKKNGYIGLYDEMMTNIVGYTTLQALLDKGIKRVRFIAVMDDRTTERCRELDGTTWNVSQLRIGYNIPPITIDSIPHPCRSALIPI